MYRLNIYRILGFIAGMTVLLSATCRKSSTFSHEITIHQHPISRGVNQWIIVHRQDSVLADSLPVPLKKDGTRAKISFNYTGKTGKLYQPGPIDIPVYWKDLPQIRITRYQIL